MNENPFAQPEPEIPNFGVPEQDFSFPAGLYVFAFGSIKGVFPENSSVPDAVLHELWALRYMGNEDKSADEKRINFVDGNPIMSTHGVKIVERYPNPSVKPTMAWRAKSFFSAFECLTEIPSGGPDVVTGNQKFEKVVDWKKVRQKYGTVFTARILYAEAKSGGNYRNIDYRSLKITGTSIPVEQMKAIETKYSGLKALEDAGKDVVKPAVVDDLPF